MASIPRPPQSRLWLSILLECRSTIEYKLYKGHRKENPKYLLGAVKAVPEICSAYKPKGQTCSYANCACGTQRDFLEAKKYVSRSGIQAWLCVPAEQDLWVVLRLRKSIFESFAGMLISC